MYTITEIKSLMDKMTETNLGELKVKNGDFELKLKAKEAVVASPQISNIACEVNQSASPAALAAAPVKEDSGNAVKSPIVGTFYAAAAPDKPPFVTVGKTVKKGDILFVIESMKLMNEIQSDFDGTITKICVENAQAVEYGQPILFIK